MEKIIKVFFWITKAVVIYSTLSFMAILVSLAILKVLGRYGFGYQFHLDRIVCLSMTAGVVITASSAVVVVINYFSGGRVGR